MLGYWERSEYYTVNPMSAAKKIRDYMLQPDSKGRPTMPWNKTGAEKMVKRYKETIEP